jgi:hypothetical protein
LPAKPLDGQHLEHALRIGRGIVVMQDQRAHSIDAAPDAGAVSRATGTPRRSPSRARPPPA